MDMSDYKTATSILEDAFNKMKSPTGPVSGRSKVLKESTVVAEIDKPKYTPKVVEEDSPAIRSDFNDLCDRILGGGSSKVIKEMDDYADEDYSDDYAEDDSVTITLPRAVAQELQTYLNDAVGGSEVEDPEFEELEESLTGDYSGKPTNGKNAVTGSQTGSRVVTGSKTGKVSNSGNVHIGDTTPRNGAPKYLANLLKSQLNQTGKRVQGGNASTVGKNALNNA